MVITSTPAEAISVYFNWLVDKVNASDDYWTMLGYLIKREFTWTIRNDGNRAADGLTLREQFEAEKGIDIQGPCTVLEMLVALACRIERDIMFDPEKGDRTGVWFWTMIHNLKLDRYSDSALDTDSPQEIRRILDIFVDREYAMNGSGGLFPLRKPEHNQRRMEIWYQMSAYIIENFDF